VYNIGGKARRRPRHRSLDNIKIDLGEIFYFILDKRGFIYSTCEI
jgi:hypothetical protein